MRVAEPLPARTRRAIDLTRSPLGRCQSCARLVYADEQLQCPKCARLLRQRVAEVERENDALEQIDDQRIGEWRYELARIVRKFNAFIDECDHDRLLPERQQERLAELILELDRI